MPKTRRTPRVETRLPPTAFIEFDQLCRLQGKTRTALARDAILWYLQHHEQLQNAEIESVLDKRLNKIENRLAGLLVRLGLDVGTIYSVMWSRSDPYSRKELFQDCYTQAVRRLRKKLTQDQEELRRGAVNS
jgi:hypothetical protein